MRFVWGQEVAPGEKNHTGFNSFNDVNTTQSQKMVMNMHDVDLLLVLGIYVLSWLCSSSLF